MRRIIELEFAVVDHREKREAHHEARIERGQVLEAGARQLDGLAVGGAHRVGGLQDAAIARVA